VTSIPLGPDQSTATATKVALLDVGLWCAKGAAARLTGEAAYFHELHWFVPREAASLERWRESGALYKAKKWDDDTYANWLEREVVPFWREADTRFGKVALEPKSSSYGNLQLLQMVSSGRVRAFELAVQGLRQHNSEVARDATQELARIDAQIGERAAKANHARD
jgi:hypothetical protein